METSKHFLHDCSFGKNCWYWLCKELNWQTAFPDNLLIFFKNWLKHGCSKVYGKYPLPYSYGNYGKKGIEVFLK